ncbi:hypothetical protein [Lysobacter arvi]|uniref:DUF3325 domain-containing protein n=1 Tax=Lysobacter arvi TaxID=3038776 RepID=A0ABU1CHI1_9GAMM|nr:hypothetical protein [Lysobacter arvi]MDR0184408.1 hypothetical protein [Lysobacter arvi]
MDPLVATTAAIATSLLSAASLYAASSHCRWPSWRRHAARGTLAGFVFALVSLWLFIAELGVGAGLCAMLGTWMLGLMALPYLAWRSAPNPRLEQDNGAAR